MNKEEIKQYLPHREPMLLIEEAFIDENGLAHAKYRIKEDELVLVATRLGSHSELLGL